MRILKSSLAAVAATAAVGALAAGCIGREVAEVQPTQNKERYKDIPVEINRDIDILFVIDNSGSMKEEQASLKQNFRRFMNELNNIEGGLPNVHIGVISTDVGAGDYGGCERDGDRGILQNAPRGTCPTPTDRYIKNVAGSNDERIRNYPIEDGKDLSDVFSCIAELGTGGCGFEQTLESMRRALNGSNSENAGFLRDEAYLAIIFITDEDDCSTKDGSMFDPTQNSVDDELGPLSSFRCFDFGVKCDPDNPRTTGQKTDCRPREDSKYMYPVQEYIDFLKGLKDDPDKVIVAGIIGNPDPVRVDLDGDNNPTLQPSCGDPAIGKNADPAVRIATLLDAFPQRSTIPQRRAAREGARDAVSRRKHQRRPRCGVPSLRCPLSGHRPAVRNDDPQVQGRRRRERGHLGQPVLAARKGRAVHGHRAADCDSRLPG